MRSWGCIALAFVFGLSETAHGQTVDEARKQEILRTGSFLPPKLVPVPAPETVHAPHLLLDPARMERDFEEGRRRRNAGIGLAVAGMVLEGAAMFLVFMGVGAEIGDSIGSGFCGCPSNGADPFFTAALIAGLIGAPFLGFGLSDWHAGNRQIRKARGYPISIVPSVGGNFAGVGATLAF